MKRHPNIEIRHKCLNCDLRNDGFFCNFSESILQSFYSLKITNTYREGATLFTESEPSNGVYMLCQGRVKLSTCSQEGRALILRIAEPGELLGLAALLSDSGHEATAEVLDPCQINFVEKSDLFRFLREHADAGINALLQMSKNYRATYAQACSLGLSVTVSDKLIKLILSWCGNGNGSVDRGPTLLRLTFSHEEISEMIGTSREPVSRTLKELRERDLITISGSNLVVPDRSACKGDR
jgi:CRP/FNR family transcriptional regulator